MRCIFKRQTYGKLNFMHQETSGLQNTDFLKKKKTVSFSLHLVVENRREKKEYLIGTERTEE